MASRYIIAVDPGKTSGASMFCFEPYRAWKVGMQMNFVEICNWIGAATSWGSFDDNQLDVVVEHFAITQATARLSPQHDALHIIGVARYLCDRDAVRFYNGQTAAAAKRFATNKTLQSIGAYTPGKDHANDAARHIALFLAWYHRDVWSSVLDSCYGLEIERVITD